MQEVAFLLTNVEKVCLLHSEQQICTHNGWNHSKRDEAAAVFFDHNRYVKQQRSLFIIEHV